jgi:hypothetical protein
VLKFKNKFGSLRVKLQTPVDHPAENIKQS